MVFTCVRHACVWGGGGLLFSRYQVTATLAKVDAVKMQMADNIQESLKNAVLMEKIEDDASKTTQQL